MGSVSEEGRLDGGKGVTQCFRFRVMGDLTEVRVLGSVSEEGRLDGGKGVTQCFRFREMGDWTEVRVGIVQFFR